MSLILSLIMGIIKKTLSKAKDGADMGDFIDDELMKDWFEEAYSQIELIESNLLVLENDVNDAEAIDAIFRAAHTLKGGSATVQMDEISKFTHVLEDAMDEVRSGKVKATSAIVDVLLDALDIIKNMIHDRSNGSVYDKDVSMTIKELEKISKAALNDAPSPAEKEEVHAATVKNAHISEYDMLEINEANTDSLPLYTVVVDFDENNPMRTVGGIQVFTALRDMGTVLKTYPDFDDLYSEEFHKIVACCSF